MEKVNIISKDFKFKSLDIVIYVDIIEIVIL